MFNRNFGMFALAEWTSNQRKREGKTSGDDKVKNQTHHLKWYRNTFPQKLRKKLSRLQTVSYFFFSTLLVNVHQIRVRWREKMFMKSQERQSNFYFIRFLLLTYGSLFLTSQLESAGKREDVKSLMGIHTHARHVWVKNDGIWMMVW